MADLRSGPEGEAVRHFDEHWHPYKEKNWSSGTQVLHQSVEKHKATTKNRQKDKECS